MAENNNDFFGSFGLEADKLSTANDLDDISVLAKERLKDISTKTIQMLEDENILPFPENFETLFDRNLKQEENNEIRSKIVYALESRNYTQRAIALEKSIEKSFLGVKTMLENISVVCGNFEKIQKQVETKLKEINRIENPLGIKTATKIFFNDINTAYQGIFHQAKEIIKLYDTAYKNLFDIKKHSMYDTTLGILNKDFFLYQLAKEKEIDSSFASESVLCILQIHEEVLKNIKDKQSLISTIKLTAKSLVENLGKNDGVCYFGKYEFGVFVRNVTEQQIEVFLKELLNSVKNNKVFLNDMCMSLYVVIGASRFDIALSIEENIENAKIALQEAKKENKSFKIFQSNHDEISNDDFGNFKIP